MDTETLRGEHRKVAASPPHNSGFYNALASALHRLQGEYINGGRANLATLRRAAGKNPEQDPLAWSFALETLLPDFAYSGSEDSANDAEIAAFTTLTLYALHQRSLSQPMHRAGKSLGAAVGELTLASGSKSVKRRLDTLMLSRTQAAQHYHLRSLVNLLHAHEIPIDYARLASDLWALSDREKSQRVILRWGRDYATTLWKQTTKTEA